MGKKKSKSESKAKLAATASQAAATSPPSYDSRASPPLLDAESSQHKDWSIADLEQYCDLLVEKYQVQVEKHDLEPLRDERSTEKVSSGKWSSASAYAKSPRQDIKDGVNNICYLDLKLENGIATTTTNHCQHEFCSRVSSTGITRKEMKSLKYYDVRLLTEKSERMKNALRKQRDIELERVKRDEEEAAAAKARKAAIQAKSAAREDQNLSTEEIIADAMKTLQLVPNSSSKPHYPEHAASESTNAADLKCCDCGTETNPRDHRISKISEDLPTIAGAPRTYNDERIREIIEGRGNLAYYTWVAKNIRRDADVNEEYTDHAEPFDDFENYFKSIGPIPFALQLALDHEKAKLFQLKDPFSDDQSQCSECDGVQGDISFMLRKVAATEKPFVSEEKWRVRKLAFAPGELLLDCDFIVAMTGKFMDELEEKPDIFNLYIKCLIKSYEDVGVPVSEYFHETVNLIKGLARQMEFEKCEPHMRNLVRMMVTRWKVAAVEIPPEALKRGEKANRRHKLGQAREKKMAGQWEIDLDKFMASASLSTGKKATDLNAPFMISKKKPGINKDEIDATPSAQQIDILHKTNFIEKLSEFARKAAEAQRMSKQIDQDAEYADTLQRWTRIELERADNALLAARAIAEARGWMDIAEDIDNAFKAAEESDDGEASSEQESNCEAYESCNETLEPEKQQS